ALGRRALAVSGRRSGGPGHVLRARSAGLRPPPRHPRGRLPDAHRPRPAGLTPMLPTSRALCVWRRDLESWKRFAPSFFIAALSEPIFYLLGIGYGLGRFVTAFDGVPYAVFLAPGIIAFAAMNSATFDTTIGA